MTGHESVRSRVGGLTRGGGRRANGRVNGHVNGRGSGREMT